MVKGLAIFDDEVFRDVAGIDVVPEGEIIVRIRDKGPWSDQDDTSSIVVKNPAGIVVALISTDGKTLGLIDQGPIPAVLISALIGRPLIALVENPALREDPVIRSVASTRKTPAKTPPGPMAGSRALQEHDFLFVELDRYCLVDENNPPPGVVFVRSSKSISREELRK